jgi:hypothetical protein
MTGEHNILFNLNFFKPDVLNPQSLAEQFLKYLSYMHLFTSTMDTQKLQRASQV